MHLKFHINLNCMNKLVVVILMGKVFEILFDVIGSFAG